MRTAVPLFFIAALCSVFAGCLSIGTKTIKCEHTGVDEQRLVRLEQRLNTLEQLAGVSTAAPQVAAVSPGRNEISPSGLLPKTDR